MDIAEQAEGEKRVRRMLVEPLLRRGLAKPGSLTKDMFDDMLKDLCSKLAYMSDLNIGALEEEVAGMAGGKARDRFPIANVILERAGRIQPPVDDGSPLIRAVFANRLGQDALDEGWAPELLASLRQTRRWPGTYVVRQIREQAASPVRHLRDVEAKLARDGEVPASDRQWRDRRLEVVEKCQRIADLASQGEQA
ncbi:hypothetical protein [Antarcticimicrobium sediminis]|uniref:Uncharacterized protein n=1 Tax=Antarcticimicrobium sediminis TaxID=2546227 RepID=A0A4R5EHZ7_9RHOB|nr:hypothetical protein [Antarcticimicrobium sediminis]TDE34141.1 hypothetical protein E1B25_20340 [Antarcticimicrobium sediminis]